MTVNANYLLYFMDINIDTKMMSKLPIEIKSDYILYTLLGLVFIGYVFCGIYGFDVLVIVLNDGQPDMSSLEYTACGLFMFGNLLIVLGGFVTIFWWVSTKVIKFVGKFIKIV